MLQPGEQPRELGESTASVFHVKQQAGMACRAPASSRQRGEPLALSEAVEVDISGAATGAFSGSRQAHERKRPWTTVGEPAPRPSGTARRTALRGVEGQDARC